MTGMSSRVLKASALMAAIAALPLVGHATEVVTFDWVPTSENPAAAQTVTPSGTLQLTLSSFALTGTNTPPNLGMYYASGTASTADVTGFSYTNADGVSVGLSNLTSKTVSSATWVTSGLDTPAPGAQEPAAPTAGYYLVSGFSFSGSTAQGSTFMIANGAGTKGATYTNGIANADNNFQAGSQAAITDGGYWEMVSATPVPLPAALPMLLGGMGLVTRFKRRRLAVAVA